MTLSDYTSRYKIKVNIHHEVINKKESRNVINKQQLIM